MSVQCTLMLKSKHTMSFSYVCFGFLKCLNHFDGDYTTYTRLKDGKREDISEDEFASEVRMFTPDKLVYVDYTPEHQGSSVYRERFAEMFKEMIKCFPMFDNLKFMPKDCKVRCFTKNQPADKIAIGLMMSRHIAYSVLNPQNSLSFALDKGYPLPVAVAFSTVFWKQRGINNSSTFYYDNENEDCLLDFNTLGEEGLSNFLNQPEGYSPWYQETFHKDSDGYLRDDDFRRDEDVFNCYSVQPEYDDWGDISNWDELENTGMTFYRKLISCFSIDGVNDNPIPGLQDYCSEYHEFVIIKKYNTEEDALQKLNAINSLYKGDQNDQKAA